MSKIIAVTGATGSQGGGVVNVMRKTPGWAVRAVTRNPTSEAAKKLAAAGVEVVQASFDDEASLVNAFQVSLVFRLCKLNPIGCCTALIVCLCMITRACMPCLPSPTGGSTCSRANLRMSLVSLRRNRA